MFAVFEAKGFQYFGSPGERLRIPRLGTKIGEKVTFDKVLLVKNEDTKIGRPYIEGASITAKIVEHGRYKKIIVFKFKRRKRYKRTKGHRQTYTEIEIKDIILGGKATAKKKSEKKKTTKGKTKKTTGKTKKKTGKAKKATKKTTARKKKSSKTKGKSKKKDSVAKKGTKKTAKKKKTTKKKRKTAKKKKTTAKSKKTSNKTEKTKKSTSKKKKKNK
jgi:large subunit ribosomal protein L21